MFPAAFANINNIRSRIKVPLFGYVSMRPEDFRKFSPVRHNFTGYAAKYFFPDYGLAPDLVYSLKVVDYEKVGRSRR
jgi:hypothetical protein